MPVAIDLGVILASVVALLVAFGMLYVWRGAGKPVLLAFAALFNVVSIPTPFGSKHPLGFIASWLEDAAKAIDHSLGQLVLNCEKAVVITWHGLAKQAELLGKLLAELAETLEGKWKWWLALFPPAALVWGAIHAARAIPKIVTRTRVVEHNITKAITRTVHVASTEYVTKVVHVAAAATAVAELPARIRARLHNVERWVTAAGAVALVGAALARLGLGWLRCSRVANTGSRVCGMNPDLLESLLADTLLIAGTVSLVEFAKGMQDVTGEVVGPIRTFWRAA